MGFSAMDGFYLAVFLAVCISAAVILRCICYRCCFQSCSQKGRQTNGEMILPRHTTPTITPARPQPYSQVDGNQRAAVAPQSRAVFTIYTFPQHESPELERTPPRTPGPPKYSSLPADAPPKYEDLFPQADFTFPSKTPSPRIAPPTRNTIDLQPLRSSPQQNTIVPLAPPPVAVPPPPGSHFPAPRVPSSAPSSALPPSSPPSHSPSSSVSDPSAEGVPREAPPTYTAVPPSRDGE